MARGLSIDRLSVTARFFPQAFHAKRPAALWATGIIVGALVLAWWNLDQLLAVVRWVQAGLGLNDWAMFEHLDPLAPYASNAAYKWAVPMAWLWGYVVVPMGFLAWTALHFAALALIRRPIVVVAALCTYPFWHDVVSGNVVTFCFVAAWLALSGNRAGIIAYCILAATVPRPLMLPILAVLLWRHPLARWTFLAAAAGVILTALATGQLEPWIHRLLFDTSTPEMAAPWNFYPSHWLGWAGVLLTWPLALLAFRKGWVGIASVLFSPYFIGYYALFALLDLRQNQTVLERGRAVDATRRARLSARHAQPEVGSGGD